MNEDTNASAACWPSDACNFTIEDYKKRHEQLSAERDALKLKAADRDERQQVAMKVSKERDTLRAREHELLAQQVELCVKLDASERANAAFRTALDNIAAWQQGDVVDGAFDEPSAAAIARHALSSDAGRDYVPRAELDAALTFLRDADHVLSQSYDVLEWPAEPDCLAWRTRDAIRAFVAARDKTKKSAE